MDPLVGVGAAASIITCLAAIYETIRRLEQCHDRTVTMRRRMARLLTCTVALRDTVNTVRTTERLTIPSGIENLIHQCLETIEEVDRSAYDFIPFEDDNILRRIRKMITTLRRQGWVEEREEDVKVYTDQVAAWLSSQRLADAMNALGVFLLRWFTRKRPSTSTCGHQVLRGSSTAWQVASMSPRTRRERKNLRRTTNQAASLPIVRSAHCVDEPIEAHELSWVDPKFRTAGKNSEFAAGRVLRVLWFVPTGASLPETSRASGNVRRFIMVEGSKDQSVAIPILTYSDYQTSPYVQLTAPPSRAPGRFAGCYSAHNRQTYDVPYGTGSCSLAQYKRGNSPSTSAPSARYFKSHLTQREPNTMSLNPDKLDKIRLKLRTWRTEVEKPQALSGLSAEESSNTLARGFQKRLGPVLKARKDLFRSLGNFMQDCRGKKMQCSISHHSLEDLLDIYPDAADDVSWALRYDTPPDQVDRCSTPPFPSLRRSTTAMSLVKTGNSQLPYVPKSNDEAWVSYSHGQLNRASCKDHEEDMHLPRNRTVLGQPQKILSENHQDIHLDKEYTMRFSNHERSSDTPVLDVQALTELWVARRKLRYQKIQPLMERDIWHDGNLEGREWNKPGGKNYTHWKKIGSAISVS